MPLTKPRGFPLQTEVLDGSGPSGVSEPRHDLDFVRYHDIYSTYHDLGFWYFGKGDFAKASRYFEEATKRGPCPLYVYKMWAYASDRNGELEKAFAIWVTIRGIWPDDPEVDFNVARLKAALEERSNQSVD